MFNIPRYHVPRELHDGIVELLFAAIGEKEVDKVAKSIEELEHTYYEERISQFQPACPLPNEPYYTIGIPREDGDLDVFATLNNDTAKLPEDVFQAVAVVLQRMHPELAVYYREDTPDVVHLEEEECPCW